MNDEAGQMYLFDLGNPQRRYPTEAELNAALTFNANLVARKFHKGKPPRICDYDWEIFIAQIKSDAWKACREFRHGGSKTLQEFTYLACYYRMRNIQVKSVNENKKYEDAGVLDVPLLDYIDAVA